MEVSPQQSSGLSSLHVVNSNRTSDKIGYIPFTFTYEGKQYSCDLVSSKHREPYYHWVIFNETEMSDKLGETLTFKEKNGKFEALYLNKHTELIESIKKVVIELVHQTTKDSGQRSY